MFNVLTDIIKDTTGTQTNNYTITLETIYCIILAAAILIIFIYLLNKIINLENKIKKIEEKNN